MIKWLTRFSYGTNAVLLLFVGFLIWERSQAEVTVPTPDPDLVNITAEEREFYKSKIVSVYAGKFAGSGCEIEPGYYLTALHVIKDALVDGDPIYVGSTRATIVSKGKVDDDFAVISTLAQPSLAKALLPAYEFQEGEDIVVTGNPGNQYKRVQSGKITNLVVMDEFSGKSRVPLARKIHAEYIKSGISGGCVYPKGWTIPVAIASKSDGDPQERKAIISLARKRLE